VTAMTQTAVRSLPPALRARLRWIVLRDVLALARWILAR